LNHALRLRAALMPLVAARELRLCNDMILHDSLHHLACDAIAKVDRGYIQSIECEDAGT